MRIFLLTGTAIAGLCLTAPAMAGPVQLLANLTDSHADQSIGDCAVKKCTLTTQQTVRNDGNIHNPSLLGSAAQIGVNAAFMDSKMLQRVTVDQTVTGPKSGSANGTQAVQLGANVDFAGNHNTQVVALSQTLNEKNGGGRTSGLQALQLGANVALGSSKATQIVDLTQKVSGGGNSGPTAQIGANVALGGTGAIQTIQATQTVRK